jgi:hypothetical protein
MSLFVSKIEDLAPLFFSFDNKIEDFDFFSALLKKSRAKSKILLDFLKSKILKSLTKRPILLAVVYYSGVRNGLQNNKQLLDRPN